MDIQCLTFIRCAAIVHMTRNLDVGLASKSNAAESYIQKLVQYFCRIYSDTEVGQLGRLVKLRYR